MSDLSSKNPAGPAARGIYECPVLQIDEVARGIFLMRLLCPEISRSVQPGQFVNVQVRQEPIPLLRRPFSVCRVNTVEGTFDLLWKAIGIGTELMAKSRPGDRLNVLGPLGRGFSNPKTPATMAIVVAGGLGVAPMPMLVDNLRNHQVSVRTLLGARTKDELWGAEIFAAQGAAVRLATDDGSSGLKGFVTALLQEELQHHRTIEVFACGPMPMLANVSAICLAAKISAQLAVETMMGCGLGICMGCPMVPWSGVEARGRYLLACTDGPVFRAGEVSLNE